MIRFSNIIKNTTRTGFIINTNKCSTQQFINNKTTTCSSGNNNNRYFFSKLFGNIENDTTSEPVTKEITKTLNYPVNQVYKVVLKVEEYKDFLPFCAESKIISKSPPSNTFEAELEVGQGAIKESYISKVVYKENDFIESTATDTNLFHKLVNKWTFKQGPTSNTCIANCKLLYQFKSPFYATMMDKFFASSLDTMIDSFDKRCDEIYGSSINKHNNNKNKHNK